MQIYLAGTSLMPLTMAPKHSHAYFEVVLNTSGEGVSSIGDSEYPFSPGTIHIIPPNVEHSKTSQGGFQDIFFISDAKVLYDILKSSREPIILQDDDVHSLEKLMSVLVTRFLKQKRFDPLLETTHQAVIQQLKEWCENDSFDSTIDEIVSRIDNSFNHPDFTVTDALGATGYNIDYIRRRFYAVMGMTPNQYLTEQRIKYARHLLWHQKQLNLTIGEIAALSGYYDVSYFSRIFRKTEGLTPKEFANGASGRPDAPGWR